MSEIVLCGGKGAGVLYPPRNQSLAAGGPGSLWEGWGRWGTPNLPGTCSKATPVHKGEHLSSQKMGTAGKGCRKGSRQVTSYRLTLNLLHVHVCDA